jgi:hypothetical protein
MAALLQGVTVRIIAKVTWQCSATGLTTIGTPEQGLPVAIGSGSCGPQPDGRPPPNAGRWYIAVHPLGATNADPDAQGNDRYYTVGVTITMKLRDLPQDRRGAELVKPGGLLELAEQIADAIHQDDGPTALLWETNKLIPGTAEYLTAKNQDPDGATVNGFCEPLRLVSIGVPTEAPPSWANEEDGEGDDPNDMLTVLVTFNRARRVKHLGS